MRRTSHRCRVLARRGERAGELAQTLDRGGNAGGDLVDAGGAQTHLRLLRVPGGPEHDGDLELRQALLEAFGEIARLDSGVRREGGDAHDLCPAGGHLLGDLAGEDGKIDDLRVEL